MAPIFKRSGLMLAGLTLTMVVWEGVNPQPTPAQRESSYPITQPGNNLSPEDHFLQGNLTLAIQQWSTQIRNGQNILNARYGRAQAYIMLKQYQLALLDAQKIIEAGQNTLLPHGYILQGIAQTELNQLEEAIDSFNQADRLFPIRSTLIYNNRALAYQRNNQLDQALADLEMSVHLHNTDITRINLANVRLELGDYQGVIDDLTPLIKARETFFPAYVARGIAYYNLGQYEQALGDFLFALEINASQPEAHYYAGLSLAALDRLEVAQQSLVFAADLYLQQNQPLNYQQVLEKMGELGL